MRTQTRRQRYNNKASVARTYPISIVAINFLHEENLAFMLRACVSFGVDEVLLLGSHPPRAEMNRLSGTMFDFANIKYFTQPIELLGYIKSSGRQLVSLELPDDDTPAQPIHDFDFCFDRGVVLVAGNEMTGIPVEILRHSQIAYIPHNGIGFCLNTSQAITIAIYEATRKYEVMNADRFCVSA